MTELARLLANSRSFASLRMTNLNVMTNLNLNPPGGDARLSTSKARLLASHDL